MRRTGCLRAHAFTLVELLVVIGIIALLISILLPVLSSARKTATDAQCASNIRQLCTALIMYAGENKGKFPPNINGGVEAKYPLSMLWYDAERIGKYLPKTIQYGTGSIGGNVLICPRDQESAGRSYAMNYFASGAVNTANQRCAFASYFSSASKPAAQLLLISEKFSHNLAPNQTYASNATIGASKGDFANPTGTVGNYPGRRFIGDLQINFGVRFGICPTEFDYSRHRRRGEGRTYADADGRVNVGFADGHVSLFRPRDVADPATGKSKFEIMWSPMDRAFEQKYLP